MKKKPGLPFPVNLGSSNFHRLQLHHALSLVMTDQGHQKYRNHAEYGRDLKGALEKIGLMAAQDMVGADSDDEEGSSGKAGEYRMRELAPDIGIGEQSPKIQEHHPSAGFHKADRRLHKRVSNQDPVGRQDRANGYQPYGCQMHTL